MVVTGVGMVSPLGNDVETSWSNLIAGESGAGEIQQFDADEFPVHFACELKDFDPTQWLDNRKARKLDSILAGLAGQPMPLAGRQPGPDHRSRSSKRPGV